MGLNVGNLRYKIDILIPAISKNDYGEIEETFINFLSIRAEKKEISGNKNIDNNEIFASTRIDWHIHYKPSINETMQIKYNNKNYKIIYIQEIGFKEGLIIQTELINN